MNRKLAIVGVLIGMILIFGSCMKPEPIKIGFAGSLSGSSFELGLPAKNGFLLAVETINNSGGINGRKIIPVIKDDESNPEVAYEIGQEFAAEDVKYVVGHLTSNMADAVIETISKESILYISPTMSTAKLSKLDDTFLRVNPVSNIEGDVQNEILTNIHAVDKVAVVYDIQNKAFSEPIYLRFRELFEANGGTITLVDKLEDENRDYSQIASDIYSSDAEGLVLITNTIDAAGILQQLAKMDSLIPTALSGWVMTNDFLVRGGSAVEGVYISSSHKSDAVNPKYQEFLGNYETKFQEESSFTSHLAYDSLMVLKRAMEEGDTFDINEVKQKIIEIKEFEGLQEKIVIDEYGDAYRPQAITTIMNGEFKELKEFIMD